MDYDTSLAVQGVAPFQRAFRRFDTRLTARAVQDGFEIPCTVRDISAGGARVYFDNIAMQGFRGYKCRLQIEGLGTYPCERTWQDRFEMGFRFVISDLTRTALIKHLDQKFSVQAPARAPE